MQRIHPDSAASGQPMPIGDHRRSGLAVIWVIACLPIVIAAIAFVVSIGRLNLARTELKTAAESAALGGAVVWGRAGDGASNDAAGRTAGMAEANAMVSANTSLEVTPTVNTIEMGTYVGGVFTPGAPAPTAATRAVRVTLSVSVAGKFGAAAYTVKTQALGYFNGTRAVLSYY